MQLNSAKKERLSKIPLISVAIFYHCSRGTKSLGTRLIYLFLYSQISALRLLKANSTMNLVDNFRPVQPLDGRTVKVSFKAQSEATTVQSQIPTEPGHAVAVKLTTALFLLMLSVAFFLN